ncbi:MAG TPA: hypothetical protein VNV85_17950 [Puia sp.]|jgi:hypothetical protein|nr:hypothetical protein [Puia sp.]
MKWKTFLASALLVGLFFSCKKDSSNNAQNNPNKLKMYIEDATNTSFNEIDSFNFTYDGNNRITSLFSPKLKTAFTYTSNSSFTIDLYTYGVLNVHEIAYINSSSLVDSTFQYNNTGDTTTEGYLYSGKTLLRISNYNYSKASGAQILAQDDYTSDNNGNMTKDIQSDGSGNIITISTFTYTNNPLNYYLGPTYLPQSKFLPATQVQTDGSGGPIASVTYSYVFDSSNRVVKETDALDNGESVVKTFIYY